MAFPKQVWDQLKNITADELIKALVKDGWVHDESSGAIQVYRHVDTGQRVTIHYHPQKTYGPKLLKGLLADIGWSIEDMKRLKLIKKQ